MLPSVLRRTVSGNEVALGLDLASHPARRQALTAYAADVVTDFNKSLPLVLCRRDEIGQVMLNLLINAAHAIEEKIGMNPAEEKGKIAITTKFCDEWAEIRISNTGTGIPEDIRDRIFDPFFYNQGSRAWTGPGTRHCS